MTDRPIIFSGPMVRALLDGRKTQTRRLASSPLAKCQPGDRLWVRETCRAEELSRPPQTRPATAQERAALRRTEVIVFDELDGQDGIRYFADDHWQRIENTAAAGEAWSALFHYRGRGKGSVGNHVPSIHMPRWASRLTLVVTEVRRQRLQAITPDDCLAEGIPPINDTEYWAKPIPKDPNLPMTYMGAYCRLWEQLHGAGSWDANPEVVALTFAVHRANIDQMAEVAA